VGTTDSVVEIVASVHRPSAAGQAPIPTAQSPALGAATAGAAVAAALVADDLAQPPTLAAATSGAAVAAAALLSLLLCISHVFDRFLCFIMNQPQLLDAPPHIQQRPLHLL